MKSIESGHSRLPSASVLLVWYEGGKEEMIWCFCGSVYSDQEVRQVSRNVCKAVAGFVRIDPDFRIAEDV